MDYPRRRVCIDRSHELGHEIDFDVTFGIEEGLKSDENNSIFNQIRGTGVAAFRERLESECIINRVTSVALFDLV